MKKAKQKVPNKDKQPKLPFDKQEDDYEQEHEKEMQLVPHQARIRKSVWLTSLVVIGISILGGFFTTGFADEGTAGEVVSNRISTSTVAGEQLFTEETNAGIEARDFEVTNAGPDGGEARMLIWDFNMVDLDEVAIFVNGTPVKERLVISENAASISIPVPSQVTITGVTDIGGGISYAVKFPNNMTTYYNVVTVGQSNTYTVLPK